MSNDHSKTSASSYLLISEEELNRLANYFANNLVYVQAKPFIDMLQQIANRPDSPKSPDDTKPDA